MQLLKGDANAATYVVYWNQPGAVAVRKRIPNGTDPGYLAALAAGYTVKTVPQAVMDSIPDATVPTVELNYARFVTDVSTRITDALTAAGISLSVEQAGEIGSIAGIAAADEIDRRARDNNPATGPAS